MGLLIFISDLLVAYATSKKNQNTKKEEENKYS